MHLRAWGMYVHRLDVHRRREGVTMWGATWGVVAKCCDAFFSLLLLSPFHLSSSSPPSTSPPPSPRRLSRHGITSRTYAHARPTSSRTGSAFGNGCTRKDPCARWPSSGTTGAGRSGRAHKTRFHRPFSSHHWVEGWERASEGWGD